ncbi:MAG: hypothetical protein ACXWU4_11805 [Allosphingosinicella sp.]
MASAYDIAHETSPGGFDFQQQLVEAGPTFILLDSGGYEALWNRKARQAGLLEASDARNWSRRLHNRVLRNWPKDLPVVAVTFDTPERSPGSFEKQIAAGRELGARFPHVTVELLLKPPRPSREPFLSADALAPVARNLGEFAIIGVTEDEIGESMSERLAFLTDLRALLDQEGLHTPIHVFGGLETLMTPLYFWAGADVFDGLSWLRYAYVDGRSLYAKSFIATEYPNDAAPGAYAEMRRRNVRALTDLQIAMQQFLVSQDASVFGPIANRLELTWKNCS